MLFLVEKLGVIRLNKASQRERLLKGSNEVGLIMQHVKKIGAFEQRHAADML